MTGPTGTQRGEAPEPGREGRVAVAAPKRQASRRAQRPRRPAHWTKKQVSTRERRTVCVHLRLCVRDLVASEAKAAELHADLLDGGAEMVGHDDGLVRLEAGAVTVCGRQGPGLDGRERGFGGRRLDGHFVVLHGLRGLHLWCGGGLDLFGSGCRVHGRDRFVIKHDGLIGGLWLDRGDPGLGGGDGWLRLGLVVPGGGLDGGGLLPALLFGDVLWLWLWGWSGILCGRGRGDGSWGRRGWGRRSGRRGCGGFFHGAGWKKVQGERGDAISGQGRASYRAI